VRGRLLQPGAYALRVRVVDGVGRSAVSSSRTIRIRRAVASRVISSGPRSAQRVALTFDDCFDGASWSRMLATLDRLGVKASFFCNGRYVRAFAAAARRTVRDGHTVGAHTWSHPQMPSLPAAAQRREIARDVDAWWEVARAAPTPYFRPPYGLHDGTTRTQAGELGFAYTVMWDVDPSDYLNPPRGRLVDHVVSRSRAGSIVVMHVNANTAAALPDMVRGLRARGLEPVSLDELLGPRAHLSGRRARG
jgi:peptidoglycan/xylan/chitin deacetylase (PgdA/CDA1 family)